MNLLLDTHTFIWFINQRAPFDRLLISQNLIENMPIVSKDSTFNEIRLPLFGKPIRLNI